MQVILEDSELISLASNYGLNYSPTNTYLVRITTKVKGISVQINLDINNYIHIDQIYVLRLPVKFAFLSTAIKQITSKLDQYGILYSVSGDIINLMLKQKTFNLISFTHSTDNLNFIISFS
ncbi:MAG TPA: hypothetical protein VKR58_06340 [Aquella sp.]|nr:hypothetical protein [Aquella sp.]